METMNIALPESMKHFVQERVTEGGYSSVSEYVRELIRADQKRKSEDASTPCCSKGWTPASRFPSPWSIGKRRNVASRSGWARPSTRNDRALPHPPRRRPGSGRPSRESGDGRQFGDGPAIL